MKSLLTPPLHRLALASGWSASKAKALHAGRILSLHGVGDDFYPAAALARQLAYLAKHFSIVSLETLIQRFADNKLTNEIALTFDDGLRNNFTIAYPLLQKFSAPATFFVCPGLVESGRWLWTHEVRARLAFQNGNVDEAFLTELKLLGLKERDSALATLRRKTSAFQPSKNEREQYDLMSWVELQQLDPGLITIGSHSLTHPILSTLTGSELAVEIAESRRLLENRLHRTVDFFCYPNGSHNPEVVRMAGEHYRAACSTKAGFILPSCNKYQLPRIGITPQLSYLAWRLHRPGA